MAKFKYILIVALLIMSVIPLGSGCDIFWPFDWGEEDQTPPWPAEPPSYSYGDGTTVVQYAPVDFAPAVEEIAEFLLIAVPTGPPVLIDGYPHSNRINLLSHGPMTPSEPAKRSARQTVLHRSKLCGYDWSASCAGQACRVPWPCSGGTTGPLR